MGGQDAMQARNLEVGKAIKPRLFVKLIFLEGSYNGRSDGYCWRTSRRLGRKALTIAGVKTVLRMWKDLKMRDEV